MTDFRRRPREDAYLPRGAGDRNASQGRCLAMWFDRHGRGVVRGGSRASKQASRNVFRWKGAGNWELQQRRTWRRITGSLKRNNSPESSELIRQEEIAENLLKPATFFHPAAVTDATSAPSIALRLR